MPLYTGVGGVVKKGADLAVGISGVKKSAKQGYIGLNGVAKPFLAYKFEDVKEIIGKIQNIYFYKVPDLSSDSGHILLCRIYKNQVYTEAQVRSILKEAGLTTENYGIFVNTVVNGVIKPYSIAGKDSLKTSYMPKNTNTASLKVIADSGLKVEVRGNFYALMQDGSEIPLYSFLSDSDLIDVVTTAYYSIGPIEYSNTYYHYYWKLFDIRWSNVSNPTRTDIDVNKGNLENSSEFALYGWSETRGPILYFFDINETNSRAAIWGFSDNQLRYIEKASPFVHWGLDW